MPEAERWKPYAFFAMHCVVAAFAMLIGSVPEIFVEHRFAASRVGAFAPCMAVTALLAGFFVNRHEKHRSAPVVGLLGVCWLLFGLWDFWSPEYRGDRPWILETHIAFVLNNLFGSEQQCAAFECMGELLYTAPFVGMISYGFGAALGLWSGTDKAQTPS